MPRKQQKGLLKIAERAMLKGDPMEAMDALLYWGNQKLEPLTSDLPNGVMREVGLNLVGALAEVLYLLEDPDSKAHRRDGADSVRYLADEYGDEARIEYGR